MTSRTRCWPLVALLLLGCNPLENPAWELAGEPGLLYEVKLFYEKNAFEEYGRCRKPLMDGVSAVEILEEDDQLLRVAISYAYHDWVMTGEDCDRLRPGRCFVLPECQGFNTRTFTLAKDGEPFHRVVQMSGEQKRQR